MSELVTGEAVVLELRLARLASRSLSLAIDLTVQVLALTVGTLLVAGPIEAVDSALAAALALVFYVSVVVGYPVAVETATRGRSLGKLALGLRVVREDGGPIAFRHAFVRGLVGIVEIWVTLGSVALISSLASSKGKRLGDSLAGTVVVRERVPTPAAPVTAMPPPLAGWASTLDLSRVPDDLALAARQFLARATDLAPTVRDDLAGRLAGSLAAVTAPAPPPGTPAWAFLAAVVAERRRRELARLGPQAAPLRPATPVLPPSAPAAPAPRDAEGPFAPPG